MHHGLVANRGLSGLTWFVCATTWCTVHTLHLHSTASYRQLARIIMTNRFQFIERSQPADSVNSACLYVRDTTGVMTGVKQMYAFHSNIYELINLEDGSWSACSMEDGRWYACNANENLKCLERIFLYLIHCLFCVCLTPVQCKMIRQSRIL